MRALKYNILIALLLLLAFAFDENDSYEYKDTVKHSAFSSVAYKFNGKFEAARLKALIEIADNNGSVQSNDAIEYDELEAIKWNPSVFNGLEAKNSPQQIVKIYEDAAKKLKTAIQNFVGRQSSSIKNNWLDYRRAVGTYKRELEREMEQYRKKNGSSGFGNLFAAAGKGKNTQQQVDDELRREMPFHALVLDCKQFICEQVMTEGGVGSWLDVYSFMKKNEYNLLDIIFYLSNVQSRQLDKMINASILRQHLRLKPAGAKKGQKPPYKQAVIEGAGPSGLYMAFQLLMAGMEVLVVNDRPAEYTRTQTMFLDPKWMAQLSFLLGTKFDELFNGSKPEAKGFINMGGIGQVPINILEETMKQRIYGLIKYLKNNDCAKCLQLLYQTSFEQITTTGGGKNGDARYAGVILKDSKYVGRSWFGKSEKSVPMDLLVCAGGAKDRVRDKFLCKPKEQSCTRYYGVVVFDKGEKLAEKNIFSTRVTGFQTELVDVRKYLWDQNFEGLISSSSFLPSSFRAKYVSTLPLTSRLRKESLRGRVIENKKTLQIGTVTPPAYEEFMKDLEREAKLAESVDKKNAALFKEFRQRIERKWFAATYYIALEATKTKSNVRVSITDKGDKNGVRADHVNFSKYAHNAGTFPVTVTSVKEHSVKRMPEIGTEAAIMPLLITVVGDANTSPHFMTASGLSTARMGIDFTVQLIKRYHSERAFGEKELYTEMQKKLSSIRGRVLHKASEYVDLLTGALPGGPAADEQSETE